jgi:hypothetical protein
MLFSMNSLPESIIITHPPQDSQSTDLRETRKVRGMIVKGMGKSIFRFIPMTTIPLTALRPFPSSIPALVAPGRAVSWRLRVGFLIRIADIKQKQTKETKGKGGATSCPP